VNVAAVVLAAGQGTRMKSDLPKVLHPLAGRPMIDWCLRAASAAIATDAAGDRRPIVVVGYARAQVQATLGERCRFAVQEEQLGTAHAVLQALPLVPARADAVLVIYGDMPLLTAATLRGLLAAFAAPGAARPAIAMLTVTRADPQGFGRIVRGPDGAVQAIVEEADCTPEQRAIQELNPGIYCFDAAWLTGALPRIRPSAKGEYYLTDAIALAVGDGRPVAALPAPLDEVNGINTRVHLALAEAVLRERICEEHMLAGVTIVDPRATYIDADVAIGRDTLILPGCLLQGATAIGARAVIGPYTQVADSTIGDGCRVAQSVIEQARMDAGAEIGPFGHLRSGAHLGEGVHMGNFGEVKNSYLAPGVKMGHFSYIGDAQIGANANIGAGTITCNYDGKRKQPTRIGDDVFIGSDTMLVAPVTIGDGARTGAGSVVTRDVAAHSLVYGVPARPPREPGAVRAADAED
jgi:bifunctional UDP-N-acetylglucosamine pyrophosphorylase/glucosamine-1-phosphate N-acetyltransferase